MRKITALLMAFCLMLTLGVSAADYIDLDDIGYSYEFEVLEQLGIMKGFDDATYRPAQEVTRSEFAQQAAALFRLEAEAQEIFADVPASHEAAGAVTALVQTGMISKGERFRPDDNIRLSEAVKILLCGMGYGPLADVRGGYPSGYLNVANSLKLLSGISGDTVNRASMARFLYRCLNTKVLDIVSVGTEAELATDPDKTVLTQIWHMKLLTGLFTDDGTTSVSGISKRLKDAILLGDTLISTGDNTDWQGLVGYQVHAYVYDDAGDYTLGAIIPAPNRNEVVELLPEDIDSASMSSISATVEENEEKFQLDDNYILIYNNEYATGFGAEVLRPAEGSVRLLDNDGDGVYDIVFVIDAVDYIVRGVNYAAETIVVALEETVNLKDDKDDNDKDDEDKDTKKLKDKHYQVIIDGKAKDLSAIGSGDVVSLAESKGDQVTLYCSPTRVSGVLTEDSGQYITIGDKAYRKSAYFKNENFTVGNSYSASISYSGKLVKLTSVSSTEKYGFLMGVQTEPGISGDVSFKILSQDNEIVTPKCASKVRINYKVTKEKDNEESEDDRKNDGDDTEENEDTYGGVLVTPDKILERNPELRNQQLVMYLLNDKGELTGIKIAEDATGVGINTEAFSLDKDVVNTKIRIYKYNIGINYRAGSGTTIFRVPYENQMASAEDEDYSAGGLNTLSTDISYENFKLYDAKEDRSVGAMVIYESTSGGVTTMDEDMQRREPVLVTGVMQAITSGGEPTVKLQIAAENKLTAVEAKDDTLVCEAQDSWSFKDISIKDLLPGDIIQYSANTKGQIRSFTVLFRANPLPEKFGETLPGSAAVDENNDAPLTYLHTVYGKVKDINGLTLSIDAGGINENTKNAYSRHATMDSKTRVYIYNKAAKRAVVGTADDICVDDIVFTRLYNYIPTTVVVYR